MSDVLSQLQAIVKPKGGLQRLPFPLESYEHASPPLSAKRLLNLMAEHEPSDARTQGALIPTPGLVLAATCGTGPILAQNGDLPGVMYVAGGDGHFYRVLLSGGGAAVTDLGVIGLPFVPTLPDYMLIVTIAVGENGCVVCVPPNAFTCTHSGPLNALGGTFPGNVTSVAFLDGYYIFTSSVALTQFFICGLLDPTNYDALDFASAESVPNFINLVIAHRNEIWLFGYAGIEVWYVSGDLDFPFRRQLGGIIPFGVPTNRVVGVVDGAIFFVDMHGMVYRTVGYQVQRVSTHAIESIMRSLGVNSIVSVVCYSLEGHSFYAINFPTRTLVYDCATKLWHERSSSSNGLGRWRVNTGSWIDDVPVLGDAVSGKLFYAYSSLTTEDGVPILRQFIAPPIWGGGNRLYMNRLEIEMEVGTAEAPAAVVVDWSDDGGFNYNVAPRTLSTGAVGATRTRLATSRCGSFRQRVLRVTTTGGATFYALDADLSTPLAGG